jgi:hypothetical protein
MWYSSGCVVGWLVGWFRAEPDADGAVADAAVDQQGSAMRVETVLAMPRWAGNLSELAGALSEDL